MSVPFVGRARELELLVGDLETTRSGDGRFAFVVGDPGIGKTRLAERIAAIASATDVAVHWGRCWQGGGAPAFWPWIQLLRSCTQLHLPEATKTELAWAAERIAALVGDRSEDAAASDRDSGQARFRLFDAVSAYLRAHARTRPLLLVLDDLHEADESSLRLLQFVARDLQHSRVFILGTCREAEVRRSSSLTSVVTELAREGRTVSLSGLSKQEIEAYIDSVTGTALDFDVKEQVCRLTEGNPFFVSEVVRGLARNRDPGAARVEIPFTVKEAIRQRLGPVSVEARSLLEAAATIGREFDLHLLSRAVSESPGRCREILAEAVRDGLVEVVDHDGRSWRFAHVLIRDTLRETSEPGPARERHLVVANLLGEERRAGRPVRAASLAYHLLEALPLSSVDAAVDALLECARESVQQLAFAEAARDYAGAIELLERAATPDASALLHLAGILIDYAYALRFSGQLVRARETFLRAATMMRPIRGEPGSRESFARAVLGYGKVSETGRVDAELVSLLEEASGLFEDGPALASVLARLAMARYFAPDPARCLSLGRRAVEMAEASGDAHASIDALVAQHLVLWRPGTATARLQVTDALIALCEREHAVESALEARVWRVTDLLELGQTAAAELERRHYAAAAEAARLPVHRWHAAMLRSTFALLAGDADGAEREADFALAVGRSAELPNAQLFHVAQLYPLRARQGRLGELAFPLRQAAAALPSMAVWKACAAEAALAAGSRDDAKREYGKLAADGFAGVARDGMWLATMSVLVRVAVALEDREGAEVLRDLLVPLRDSWVVSVTAITMTGPVRLYLGQLSYALGDLREASAHFDSAAALCGAAGYLSLVAECEAWLARCVDGGADEYPRTTLTALAPASGEAVFRRGDDFWTLSVGGRALRLRDSKGMRYIHYLLENPERDIHVFDLVTAVEGAQPPATQAHDSALVAGREGDTGPVVDSAALGAYRTRMRELDADIAEAEACNDAGRADLLQGEREFLAKEIAAAVGLGGRQRRSGSPAEQARVRVTKVISLAMKRISTANPQIGRVLSREIRTGTFCAYRPDPDRPIRWIT